MLKVSDLSKRFGDLSVLENFNLSVPRKGFTILVGPSGCGKSTLFNVLTGVVAKESGHIDWLGERLPDLGKKCAYMQQNDLLLPWFSMLDNALLPAKIAQMVAVGLAIGVGAAVYFLLTLLLRTPELGEIKSAMRKR